MPQLAIIASDVAAPGRANPVSVDLRRDGPPGRKATTKAEVFAWCWKTVDCLVRSDPPYIYSNDQKSRPKRRGKRRHSLRGSKPPTNGFSAIRMTASFRFEHSRFEFWICFGFRASGLGFRKAPRCFCPRLSSFGSPPIARSLFTRAGVATELPQEIRDLLVDSLRLRDHEPVVVVG